MTPIMYQSGYIVPPVRRSDRLGSTISVFHRGLRTESSGQEIEKRRASKTTKSVYPLVYSSKLKIKKTEVQNVAFKIARNR